MKLLRQTSGPPLSSPQRVWLLVGAVAFWVFNIALLFSHQLAVNRLPDTTPSVAPDGVVYQSTDYSCGPACLATIIRQYNIFRSERVLAELAGTNLTLGTQLPGLKRAGHALGFETVELNPAFEQLDLICHPAILFHSREYHLVTFWGIDPSGRAIIRDPALGRITWGAGEYEFNTPGEPALLIFHPGAVPVCDSESSAIEIGRCQNMLKALGYFGGTINGQWSNRLANAVTAFQEVMDLEPTGTVDAPTSIYLEGAWRLVTHGPLRPFMMIDRSNEPIHRAIPVITRLNSQE